MAFVGKLISWRMQKRAHQMELFVKYPVEVQQEVLLKLLSTAAETDYGKRYGFDKIESYADFKKALPIATYEDLEPEINRVKNGDQNILWPTEIKWFAQSSGTTSSKSKFIPVSKESIKDCHYKGGKDMLSIYFRHKPKSEIYSGKGMILGGTKQINQINNESYYGDLSAIIISNLPFWVALKRTPDMDIMLMEDWDEKLEKMANQVIPQNITHISGVPSWMLILFKKILEKTGAHHIHEVWPNLELYMHGGVSFEPYRSQFQSLLPGEGLSYLETYNASEGFFGIQYNINEPGLMLMLDYGIYYEFIPISEVDKPDPIVLSLAEVELNENYAMLISTNSGLWRYMIGDTIKFIARTPFLFLITGRTKHFINAFGEELIIENADRAINEAAKATRSEVKDYTAAPKYISDESTGAHHWLVEFEVEPSDMQKFSEVLDSTLKGLNSDYEAKRSSDLVLQQPIVQKVPNGTFYNWLKSKSKLGGQNKIPRLANSRVFMEEILSLL